MALDEDTEKPVPHFGVYVRLAPSKIHGVGVVAIRSIPKGTPIFYGDGDVKTWVKKESVEPLVPEIKKLYQDFCLVRDGKYGCPENFNQITPAWYLNHSSKPNVASDENFHFFALRDIEANEELTADYATYSGGSFTDLVG